MEIFIDFSEIGDEEDLYTQLKEKAPLPAAPEAQTGSLIAFITDMPQPLHLEFVNLSVDQLEIFEDLLEALEDLEEDKEGFTFSYYLEQYEE